MTVRCKQRSTVEGYDQEKAEKWLKEWVDAWVKLGWKCTQWGQPSYHEMFAQIETELEVGDDEHTD